MIEEDCIEVQIAKALIEFEERFKPLIEKTKESEWLKHVSCYKMQLCYM